MNELILELFQAVSDKPELDEARRQRGAARRRSVRATLPGCPDQAEL